MKYLVSLVIVFGLLGVLRGNQPPGQGLKRVTAPGQAFQKSIKRLKAAPGQARINHLKGRLREVQEK